MPLLRQTLRRNTNESSAMHLAWNDFGGYRWISYIEYFLKSARVRCLHTSCGVLEIEQVHLTKHFPCGLMFVIYILRLNIPIKL